jgi:hypothetical protein
MGNKEYKRLQFEFSQDAVERLSNLKKDTEASSKTEVIRNSLRVYEYITSMINEGYRLEFKKDNKKVTVAPLLI